MATSKTIQDTVNWVATILKQQSLNVSNWEPGLTFANIVLGRALGPPMKWRQNRGNISFAISTAGGTDYTQVVGDLGWIEAMWLTDSNGTIHALAGAQELPKSNNSYRPQKMAAVYDDNAGNITFRMDAIPTANDTVFVDYQRKAPVATSFGSNWAPLPDEYGYVYNQLFLALAGNLVSDPRTAYWSQLGVSALLGVQTGLTVQEIAIFVGEWDRLMQTLNRSQEMLKAGMGGLTK
jgi:hypothetical protein